MILVTGVSGFIGKHLHTALVNQFGAKSILALTSNPTTVSPYLLHKNYQFEDDYFKKNNYANQITTIIHAGAFIPKNNNTTIDWQSCNANVFNTEKLLKAKLPNLKEFIFLSTVDVYGNAETITEESTVAPVSLYGESKYYCERMVESWAKNENKICQVLRVGHVYGIGEEAYQKVIPITIKKILTSQPIQLWGNGEELRAFIYVEDVVKAIINSLGLEQNIGVVNLVSNQSVSIKKLIQQLIALSGTDVNIETIEINNKPRSLNFSNAKMQKHLLANETPLAVGLAAEIEYFKTIV